MSAIPEADRGENRERHDLFLRLLMQNEPRILAFIRSLVPRHEDAADVLQEVAVVLWQKIGQCPLDDGFLPWSLTVARFQAMAFLRDKKRDRLCFDIETLERIAEAALRESDGYEDRRNALKHCLDRLPAQQRLLVLEAYRSDARIDQMARRQHKTPMSLYKTLQRIRELLSSCIRGRLKSPQ
ncbi:MAG TPA: RNA polymerase subunit sigma [Planctomycetaceae bacterium]|nr:RNA polymerase subunit sigma [Planctomycetaceae bacterium]